MAGGGGGAGGAGAAAGAQGRGGGRRAGAVPAAAGTRNPPAAGSCTHMLLPGAPVGGSQVQRGAMQRRSHETAATPHMAAASGSGPHPHAWLSNTPAGCSAGWLRCLTTDRGCAGEERAAGGQGGRHQRGGAGGGAGGGRPARGRRRAQGARRCAARRVAAHVSDLVEAPTDFCDTCDMCCGCVS